MGDTLPRRLVEPDDGSEWVARSIGVWMAHLAKCFVDQIEQVVLMHVVTENASLIVWKMQVGWPNRIVQAW